MVLVPQVKIAVPRIPTDFVSRPGLCADLDAAASDLGLICAPAGYGKTLLLADWARSSTSTDVAWVGLDRDDNDPGRLWSALVAAVTNCGSVPSSSRLHALRAWQPANQPEFIAEFADAIQELPQPIRLILDDVHELVDPRALGGLQTFIRIKPATVHLVLACRHDPPVSLPRLRLAGRLWELRAAQLSFTPQQAGALLESSGLRLSPHHVEVLHARTGGWAAGLRLAALGMRESVDHESFLAQFSGDDRSVADYLVGEILSTLPDDLQDFLRVIGICDPMPVGLAAELTGRDDAGGVLDGLERRTSLVTATGPDRTAYRVQELLRSHLLADLQRQGGVRRTAGVHAATARWWAAEDQPLRALEHAAQSQEESLLIELLHRFALRLIHSGDHGPLRRALAGVGRHAATADPWLSLVSALTHVEAGEPAAAQDSLRHAQQFWPTDGAEELAILRGVVEQCGVVEQLGAGTSNPIGTPIAVELPADPELAALARLSRGDALLKRDDREGARAELGAALILSRLHSYDYLTMQCLALLGVVASVSGELRTMRSLSGEAVVMATDRRWADTPWSQSATAMLGYSDLLRCQPAAAERRTSDALAAGLTRTASPPQLRFALRAVHAAAVFDLGDRADGLAELQEARSDFGDNQAVPEHCAAMAMLEYRIALLLGHTTAARTVLSWLAERTSHTAEPVVMRAWANAAGGYNEAAHAQIRTVLDDGRVGARNSRSPADLALRG